MKKAFEIIEDRYSGITIQNSSIEHSPLEFEEALVALLENVENKKLLWIKLSIENAEFIPLLTKQGFVFHHCDENSLMLVKKLITEPTMPTAKNHTLGVGVVVLDGKKLLTIKDRVYQTYKLPGGYIDDRENISKAAKREVFEETGIKVEFDSIISLGHFTPAQFGESNLYVVCLAKPLSWEITIQDTDEIEDAKWIDVDEYLEREDVLPYNKELVKTALKTKQGFIKNDELELQVRVNTEYELFF
ncbi:NUDIX domain-containing protein [Sulfurimonas sp.]